MPIELHSYDPQWTMLYEEAKTQLAQAFGQYALDIQHVGSTSVAGLAAKPVIDIAVLFESYPLPNEVIKAVQALGYEYKGEFGIERRHYFRKAPPPIIYHVHANARDNDQFQRHILFRDYLSAHPVAMRE